MRAEETPQYLNKTTVESTRSYAYFKKYQVHGNDLNQRFIGFILNYLLFIYMSKNCQENQTAFL